MSEWVDIWTKDGKPTGEKTLKSEAHARGYYHPTVHLWIYNSRKEVLLQKRAPQKKTFPGKWDVSVAGHISAGDTPEDTLIRESHEELGLIIKPGEAEFARVMQSDIQHSEQLIDREHHHIYFIHRNLVPDKLKLQTEEVSEVKWVGLNTLIESLTDEDAFPGLVPFEVGYLQFITDYIAARF